MDDVTSLGEDAGAAPGGPVTQQQGLRARGFVISGVLLAVGVGFLWRAVDIRQPGEPVDEGLVLWGVLFLWLLVGLISGNVRSFRQRRLVREAEASGGVLAEPPGPLLWPATVLGIVWRTVLLLVPGIALWWYALAGNTEQGTSCTSGTSCITGAGTWLPFAVILVVAGLVIAFFSARRAVRNARRRLDGLPPEVPLAPPKPVESRYTVDRSRVVPVAVDETPASSGLDRRLERLAELGRLHEQGVIDDAELERLKDEVLAEGS